MRTWGRIALGSLVFVLALAAILVVRTLTFHGPELADTSQVKLAPPVAVDVAMAAQHLSQAVQIPTVSHQDEALDQPAQWTRLHDFLASAYPAAHAAMTREIVGRNTLVYTWKGADPTLAPIVLMAHQDVVPVTVGTESDWKYPPFSGAIAEGAVWGRGSIDDKGSLITLFEGVETLARQGFKPRRSVILVSGEDEEVRNSGARAAAALLRTRGVKAQFVVDEGLAVITSDPITHHRVALIGTAEKGYGTLMVTARAQGGHSSAPPANGGGVVTLARAITAIADHGYPLRFDGPGATMVSALAAKAAFPVRMAAANAWLFRPLLIHEIGATAVGASLLHTTIAPTMLQGSPKENVLPQDATAWINYRIAPGDTAWSVIGRAQKAVGRGPVTMAWTKPPLEPSPISSTTSDGWRMLSAVAGAVTGAPVIPGLVTAGTDSRYLQPVATDVYRFQPMDFSLTGIEMIHGTNEHMTLRNLETAVQFYARLIATAAG